MPEQQLFARRAKYSSALSGVIAMIVSIIGEDELKELADDVLDLIEDKLKGRPLVLAAIKVARRVLDIPDDIGGDED